MCIGGVCVCVCWCFDCVSCFGGIIYLLEVFVCGCICDNYEPLDNHFVRNNALVIYKYVGNT